ncbi:hypothetical protein Tco_1515986 [Tanacetum coccineum]
MQTQEYHSNLIQALNVHSLKADLVVIQNTCSEKEDSNLETASSKSVKESSLYSARKDVHAIKYKMSKAKEGCMAYFCSFHSHLQDLSKEDLKVTRIEHGFKQAFMSLFGQDNDTFTSMMLLNIDQLQKQLDKDEFEEDGSMAAFWVEDANLVITKSSRTESEVQDNSSRLGNDTDADNVDIRPIYDEEPMAKIITGHRFSPNKISVVYEKTSPRCDLWWKPTGRIFKIVGLRWVPTGKILASYTSKADSEHTHGSNASLLNVKEVSTEDMTETTSLQELESLFGPLFDEYFDGENQVVSKSSAVNTADASDKRQQQLHSNSLFTLANNGRG